MMKITLLLVTLAVAYTNAQFHSAAELFNGAYSWVHLQTPQGQLQNLDKIGNIGYWPAYPGALYGNMTVSYGTPGFGPSSACATVMTDFSSYTGGYQVFPNGNGNGLGPYVEHYPIISSNPINGKTPVGVPAPRYYHLYEDDTLLDVCSFSGTAPNFVPGNCLRWRRNFPLPGPGKPNASVKLTRSGGWSSNGVNYNQYQVTITNTGGTNLNTVVVELSLAPGSTIGPNDSWNLNKISGTYNSYTVSVWGLAPGASSSAAGFTQTGDGVPYAGANPANLS